MRGQLVHGDAGLDVGAVGFAGADPGEKRGVGACVVAGAIVAGRRIFMIKAADDLDGIFQRGERLHRAAEFEGRAFAGGPPVLLVGAIGEGDERHAQRSAGARDAKRAGGTGNGRRTQQG